METWQGGIRQISQNQNNDSQEKCWEADQDQLSVLSAHCDIVEDN